MVVKIVQGLMHMYMIIELHVIKNGSNTGHQKDIMFKKKSGLRAENMLTITSSMATIKRRAYKTTFERAQESSIRITTSKMMT